MTAFLYVLSYCYFVNFDNNVNVIYTYGLALDLQLYFIDKTIYCFPPTLRVDATHFPFQILRSEDYPKRVELETERGV